MKIFDSMINIAISLLILLGLVAVTLLVKAQTKEILNDKIISPDVSFCMQTQMGAIHCDKSYDYWLSYCRKKYGYE